MNFKLFLNNYFPLTVRLIIFKALLFFVVWKFIFIFFLLDSKDHPLTTHVGEYSTKLLNSILDVSSFSVNREFRESVSLREGKTFMVEVSQVYFNNNKVVYVADECNSLELMVLYIGFIFCMPSSFWRKTLYIVLGILVLDILNIFRCSGLIYVNLYYRNYFDFFHRYLFKTVMYCATFVMWMFYSRKNIHVKNKSDKIRFVSGLIFICIIYSCYQIFFKENNDIGLIPRKLRDIIRFSVTVGIYFVGTFHLGKLKDTWMSSIWHIVHISGLCIITTIGLYYWVFTDMAKSVIHFANSIQHILISPILYISLGLLNRSFKINI